MPDDTGQTTKREFSASVQVGEAQTKWLLALVEAVFGQVAAFTKLRARMILSELHEGRLSDENPALATLRGKNSSLLARAHSGDEKSLLGISWRGRALQIRVVHGQEKLEVMLGFAPGDETKLLAVLKSKLKMPELEWTKAN